MRVKIQKRYYKSSRRGRNPMSFRATQPKGIGTDIHAVVMIDPVLKKHPDLRKPMLKHEEFEIKDWGKGCNRAHHHAKRKEPKLTRNLTVRSFWNKVSRGK